MRLDNMILTDFAATVITPINSNGEQTTRGTITSVDPNDDKNVEVLIDGTYGGQSTAATTMVKCSVDDRVMVLIKNHKATVIGNISSPVLKKVTANDIEAGAVTAETISGSWFYNTDHTSWVNLKLGTFNLDNKLSWDGTNLSVNGTLTAGAGSKIGPWMISDDQIYKDVIVGGNEYRPIFHAPNSITGSTKAFTVAVKPNGQNWTYPFSVTYDGSFTSTKGSIGGWTISEHNIHSTNSSGNYVYLNDGSGDHQDVLVVRTGNGSAASPYDYPVWIRANGEFKATNATIKGAVTATSGDIGPWHIGTEGLYYDNNTYIYKSGIKLHSGNQSATINFNGITLASTQASTSIDPGSVSTNYISATADITEGNVSLVNKYARLGSRNIFAESQSVNSTGGMVSVNYTGRSYHGVGVHTASSGRNGLWSLGYGNASNASESGVWLIFRETDGSVKTTNYIGNQSYPVVSSNDSGQIVAALRTDNATTFSVRGQWSESGTSATWKWKTITTSASDPKLKKNIKSTAVNALDILRQIKLYSFDWKADNTHWDIGFIAPELYKIDKSLAIPPVDEDSSWGVNDFYLLGVLTKGVQELSARVEELERRLNERGN